MKKFSKVLAIAIISVLALCCAGTAFAETAHMRRIRLATDLINKMAIEQDADSLADVIATYFAGQK